MANQSISQRPSASTLKNDDLLVVSQKQANGSYLTCKVTADKLKGASAYQQWFVTNTSENTYLTMQSISQLQQVSNYSSLDTFITATNLTAIYNSWLQTSTDVQNQYLTENSLINQFIERTQTDNTYVFNDFLIDENLTENFNAWTVTNKTSLLTLFVQITSATIAYNSYLTSHPNVTVEQFLAAIGAQDGFNTWLEARVAKLTEDAFNSMLVGKNGKSPAVSKYEKFWISICAVYTPETPPEEERPNVG